MTTTVATSTESTSTATRSRTHIAGVVLSVLIGAFLVFDILGKLFQPESVVEGTEKLGFTTTQATVMAIVLAVCVIVWVIPRTAVLGAIGLTAYLGGAVTANWNNDAPLVSTTLFAVYFGVALWIAMILRRPQLLEVLGLRAARHSA
ncbi:DoxX family protein [Williamsia maris]|uniref:DoxX-like family protein n=1 Tax=Williamsia maris TaxID=72806 RepID=A0ABT1HC25_9NOCA|nr:DoxX family protein [Williamsia maris]MCP2175813.1 DoxX-like family protein [Williamsia maris]